MSLTRLHFTSSGNASIDEFLLLRVKISGAHESSQKQMIAQTALSRGAMRRHQASYE